MDNELKQNIAEHSTWIRVFYMIIFFIIYRIAEAVLLAVVIFQFLSRLFTAKVNEKLLVFGANLSKFAYEILMFLTYNSEIKPFPFGEWPKNTNTTKNNPVKKRSKKEAKVTKISKQEPEDDAGPNSDIPEK